MNLTIDNIAAYLGFFEILAANVASIFFYKYRKSHLKVLLIVLWLAVFTEFFSVIIVEKKFLFYLDNYNLWLYNLMYPIFTLLYLNLYKNILENPELIKWVKRFIVTYLIAFALNWIFLQNFLIDLESYSRILGSLFITISAIFHLIELLRSDKVIIFYRELSFWVSVSLMIFYSGTIPLIIFRSFYDKLAYIHDIFMINYVLSIIMYILFIIGFIMSNKEPELK